MAESRIPESIRQYRPGPCSEIKLIGGHYYVSKGFVIMPMDHAFSGLISQAGVFTFQSFMILPAWPEEGEKVPSEQSLERIAGIVSSLKRGLKNSMFCTKLSDSFRSYFSDQPFLKGVEPFHQLIELFGGKLLYLLCRPRPLISEAGH